MKKLIFACGWEENREKSWSGTHNGLFFNLKDHYDVIDFDMNVFHKKKLFKLNVLLKYKLKLNLDGIFNRRAKRLVKKVGNVPVFQFTACPDLKDCESYIYMDMDWDNVERLYYDYPERFAHSNYRNMSIEEIKKLNVEQTAFLKKENCKGIFTMCRWLADDMRLRYGDKVHYAGWGANVNVNKIENGKKTGDKILFAGRDFERKGGPLTVEAFKILHKKYPQYKLIIIGPKTLDEKYLGDGITYFPQVSYDELVEYYNSCDTFCMPCEFEPCGFAYVEALIFGMPCIFSDLYEMPYYVEDGKTGYLIKDRNPEKLAILMEKTLCDAKMKENVLAKRQSYIEEYTWSNAAKRIAEIIK